MSKHYVWTGGDREIPGKGRRKTGDKVSENSFSQTDIKSYLEQGLIKTATAETKFTKPTRSEEVKTDKNKEGGE